jgi:cytochrome c-type biogenesis protein CcmH/NrfG
MPNLSDEREIIDGLFQDAEDALGRGALGKASSLYQGILRSAPDHVGALRQLAALEANLGDPAIALTLFERAQELNPGDADLCHGIATALRLMGQDSDSNMALIAALRVHPDHGPALYDQARRQQQEGNHKAASETFFKLAK